MKQLKSIRRTLRRPIETLCFRLGMVVVPLLPRRILVGLLRIAGRATYYLVGRERRTGMANLDRVFGDSVSHAGKRRILQRSFSGFALTMADMFWFSKNTEKRIRKYQTFVPDSGPFFEPRAQLIITAHTGNWELIGLESGLLGLNIASVAAVTKNAGVDTLLNDLRMRTGQSIIAREGALRTLINRFRQNGKAAFVLDQNTPEEQGGIWVDFLGIPTPVSAAPAMLAYRSGTEIIFAFSLAMGGGHYEAHTGPVIQPPPYDKNRDQKAVVQTLTQQIMDVISAQILAHPDSWLWSYKHWRRHAPGTDPSLYPVYR